MQEYRVYEKVADGSRVKCACCRHYKRSRAKRLVNRHVRRVARQLLKNVDD